MRIAAAMLVLALTAALAGAHVTVWPQESKAGRGEKYVVRVPTEGKVSTTSVVLEVPAGVTVSAVAVPAGWTYDLKRDGGRIVSITWTMEIKPGEFAEFAFVARNPKEGDQIVWKAHQRYADGTASDWIGPAGDRTPAPRTKLLPAATQ